MLRLLIWLVLSGREEVVILDSVSQTGLEKYGYEALF